MTFRNRLFYGTRLLLRVGGVAALAGVGCGGGVPTPSVAPKSPDVATTKTPQDGGKPPGAPLFAFLDEDAPTMVNLGPSGNLLVQTHRHLITVDLQHPEAMRIADLPDDTETVVTVNGAPISIAIRQDQVTLFDAETLRVRKTLTVPNLVDDVGAVALSRKGVWAAKTCSPREPVAAARCAFAVFDADGKPASKVPTHQGVPSLSSDGAYVVDVDEGAHDVYETSTGKRMLRRLWKGFMQGSLELQGQLFRFLGHELLMTRGEVLEITDLRTGKVLGSARHPETENGVQHSLSPDGAHVATLLDGRLIFFATASRRQVASVSTEAAVGCFDCSLHWTDASHVQVESASWRIRVAMDGKTDAIERTEASTLFAGKNAKLERTQRTSAGRDCRLHLKGGEAIAVPAQTCFPLPEVLETTDTLVLGSPPNENGHVLAYDLAKRSLRFQLGQGATPERRLIERDATLGLLGGGGSDIWLGPKPQLADATPQAGPTAMAAEVPDPDRAKESVTHSFRLRWEPSGLSLAITDKRTKQTKAFEYDAFPEHLWQVDGDRAYIAISRAGLARGSSVVCDFARGCEKIIKHRLTGVAWPWMVAVGDKSFELVHGETGERRELPKACTSEVLLLSARPEVACVVSKANRDVLTVFDATNTAQHGVPLFSDSILRPRPALANVMPWGMLTHDRSKVIAARFDSRAWVALDLPRRRRAMFAAQGAGGLVAVYPDGRYEAFGQGVDPGAVLRCREGDTLRPLATCRAKAEATGAWLRGDW
jgi:hypothetical protein